MKKKYLSVFKFSLCIYFLSQLFHSCSENDNKYIGSWVILDEMYSGRRGGNSFQIIERNDSLFIVVRKEEEPVPIKIKNDSMSISGENGIVMANVDNNGFLNLQNGTSFMVYRNKENGKREEKYSEYSPKLVAVLFATAVYKLNYDDIKKYTTEEYGKTIIENLDYIFTREKKKKIDEVINQILDTSQQNDEICYAMKLNLHTVEGEYLNATTQVCVQKINNLWKVVKVSNVFY
ncbi:MAG: hypothetical protein WBA61_04995 [Aequorivita sp.]